MICGMKKNAIKTVIVHVLTFAFMLVGSCAEMLSVKPFGYGLHLSVLLAGGNPLASAYYLAAALDCGFQEGDPDFAHPLYKKAPGQRLARLVLSAEYGLLDMEYASSPYPVSAQWKERCVQIGFRCVGEGLKLFGEGTHLIGFQIEKNGERIDAAARITGKNMVEVSCPGEAEAVCYGMQQLAGPDICLLYTSPSPRD